MEKPVRVRPWQFFVLSLIPAFAFVCPLSAQNAPEVDLEHRPAENLPVAPSIRLTVPKGSVLEVATDSEIRVKHVGQAVRCRLVEPVYAFDQLEIPAGSEIDGEITAIQGASVGRRTEAALNADFTPERKVEVGFAAILLPTGKQLPIQTTVAPGSGQLLDFVSTPSAKGGDRSGGNLVSAKVRVAKQQAHAQWDFVMGQVKRPGKVHRLKRYVLAQLPVHPQFVDAGTIYFAELQQPLDFGSEPMTPAMAQSIGNLSPTGGVVHARLETALTSASNHNGDDVDALITQPLFEDDRLLIPQGSLLTGSVVQVRPAKLLSKNGQLRIAFHQLQLPDGTEQAIEANLQSVEAGKSSDVKLDSEGGAQARIPKTRYLSTAVEIGLAGLSVRGDPDAKTPNPAGNTGNRMAGGVGGYKLIGVALGIFVHSRAFGTSMGAYGAGMSVYSHFIARGRDVIFPKDTAIEIGLGTHEGTPPPSEKSPVN